MLVTTRRTARRVLSIAAAAGLLVVPHGGQRHARANALAASRELAVLARLRHEADTAVARATHPAGKRGPRLVASR